MFYFQLINKTMVLLITIITFIKLWVHTSHKKTVKHILSNCSDLFWFHVFLKSLDKIGLQHYCLLVWLTKCAVKLNFKLYQWVYYIYSSCAKNVAFNWRWWISSLVTVLTFSWNVKYQIIIKKPDILDYLSVKGIYSMSVLLIRIWICRWYTITHVLYKMESNFLLGVNSRNCTVP